MDERFGTFTVLIASISRSIRRIKTHEMASFGLKSPHVSCLYYLYRNGGLTATELCDICDEDKASISRSIKYLEDQGYLICKSSSQKRYLAPLELTEKGMEIGEQIAERIDRILNAAGDGLSDEGRAVLYDGLELVNRNLQYICEEF